MANNNYKWIDFYMEFAGRLLEFKGNRTVLIQKIKEIYKNINMKLPKLEDDNIPKDMDPFTVFGLFNKGISNANRIAIIKGIAVEFGVQAAIPDVFDGIPVLNNLSATFYLFQGDHRGEHDIDNLWNLFEKALIYADDDTDFNRQAFEKAYDMVLTQRRIRWNITMGLYWIRPYVYVNLDSRNRWYMSDPGHMPADYIVKIKSMLGKVPSAEQYLEITKLCRAVLDTGKYEYRTFPELSFHAWMISEQVNQEQKAMETGKRNRQSGAAHTRWTRPVIQALRDLGGSGTPAEVRERIIKNERLTQEEISVTRGKTNVNKFENEVAFARNDLAVAGYLDKSVRGVWTLTEAGKTVDITEEMASDLFRNNYMKAAAKRSNNNDIFADNDVDTIRYWIYAPGQNAVKWEECCKKGIMLLGWGEIGDLSVYDSKDEMKQKMKEIYGESSSYVNSGYATWQFVHDMKSGDIIYVKKGFYEILGRGIVESAYEYDAERSDEFNHIRHVRWTHKGKWTIPHQTPQKTLTDITPYGDFVKQLKELFDDDLLDKEEERVTVYPPYDMDDFLSEVYMDEESYNSLVAVLKKKKNIILQGAPGVGKTYVAKRLAYAVMGIKDVNRVSMVQFHQSYSYEDFIMGYRPSTSGSGFEIQTGVFYKFCKEAEKDSDNDYFFIIDEINRGNLSRIFGELFMLIENDKRGIELEMLYSNEKFMVPKNVYMIGMMNTADRSLAMLDYALRRRFAFVELKPGFESEGFRTYMSSLDYVKFNRLIACVEKLNQAITEDDALGEGFCIGHSYFCNLSPNTIDDNVLSDIIEYELIPLLKEYWYDEPAKVRDWSSDLWSAIR